jgi:formate hydrogenlyase subunit 3/multisubunit Na+/H+ antiporter MnhD subunit
MFRVFASVLVLALVALPAVLIALRWRTALPVRLATAAMVFVTPLVLIWLIHLVPAFDGRAPEHASLWRGVGIVLSASTLILPWLIYSALREHLDR